MRYEISVEGGFSNIPKSYSGDIYLPEDEKRVLFHLMASQSESVDTRVRDSLVYQIKLIAEGEILEAVFDDTNIPQKLRSFIAMVSRL